MDVSFISVRLLLLVVREWLRKSIELNGSIQIPPPPFIKGETDKKIPLSPPSLTRLAAEGGPLLKGETALATGENNAGMVVLFKPQFEVGKQIANRFRGVIADEQVRLDALADFRVWLSENQFAIIAECESPIQGDKGNHEYLLHLR